MNIEIKESNGGYFAILSGWLDTNVATEFLEELKTLEEHADKAIELDCGKLDLIVVNWSISAVWVCVAS